MSDFLQIGEEIVISHREDCPVSQADFRLPMMPDGTVDMNAPQRCTCDFMGRLRAFVEDGEIIP
jgi:hypothetical protein